MHRRQFLAGASAFAALSAAGIGLQEAAAASPNSPSARAALAASLLPENRVRWGVFHPGLPWETAKAAEFEDELGRKPGIVHWFHAWGGTGNKPDPLALNAAKAIGALPLITWEPWDWQSTGTNPYSPKSIAAGKHDRYIRDWARALKLYRDPVLLRFAPEMNGTWKPWSIGLPGSTERDFRNAWRRCVSLFRSAGVTNVLWVWCPNISYYGSTPLATCFPGVDYVDVVGLDAYNWGTTQPWSHWQPFSELFGATIAEAGALTSRPVVICETASTETGGEKAAWITNALGTELDAFPGIRGICWFNQNKETDWRIESSGASIAAFRSALSASKFSP